MPKPLVPGGCDLNVGVGDIRVALENTPGWSGGGLEVIVVIAH